MSRRLMVVVLGGGLVVGIVGEKGLALTGAAPWEMVLDVVCYATFLIGGVVAWAHRPDDRTGRLMVAIAYAGYGAGVHGFGIPVLVTLGLCLGVVDSYLRAFVLVAYPGGRLYSRSLRWFIGVTFVVQLGHVIYLTSTQFEGGVQLFTISFESFERGWNLYSTVSVMFTVAVSGILVARWFRGSTAYRQVMGPVLFLGAIPGAFLIVIMDQFGPAVLEAMLTGFYLANILMALALVFGILRTRLVGTVGELVVDLSRPLPPDGLREALARALRDPSLDIFFNVPDPGWVDSSGERVELPADRSGRAVSVLEGYGGPIAALIYDAVWLREPEVVSAAAAAARLALENERLHAELRARLQDVRASRARLVEAADVERRRLERDLHDGAQQRLVTLALAMREAQRQLNGSDPGVAAMLEEAIQELRSSLNELRELARGIHPAILTEQGLAAAVESLAERCPLPVAVANELSGRMPPQVEDTAYFVVSEALTNTVKHARASRVDVRTRSVDARLVVDITDDGIGGADVASGSGLRGLADRVAALDGRLDVESIPGLGTHVVVEIPCGSS